MMELLSPSSSILLLAIALVSRYVFFYFKHRSNLSAPVIENSWLSFLTWRGLSNKQLLENAYQKYGKNGKPYRTIGPCGPQWALPTAVFEQANKMSATLLDPAEANEDMLVLRPFLGTTSEDMVAFVVAKITRSIPVLIPSILSSTDSAFRSQFAPVSGSEQTADGWTHVCLQWPVQNALAVIVSRIMLGEKYSTNPEFVKTTATFARGIFFHGMFMRRFPSWMWGFLAPWMSTMSNVKKIEKALKDDVQGLVRGEEGVTEDDIMLPWVVTDVMGKKKFEGWNEDQLGKEVIQRVSRLLFATVDTTALTFTHILYDILGFKKDLFVEPMREEIRRTKRKYGGAWTMQALGELKLVDSFMKESQRMHPLGYTLGSRKVTRQGGVTFHVGDGQDIHVKQGDRLEMPAWAVHMDPQNYEDPYTFNGFRHANDNIPSAMPSEKFMSFGFGRHACPGRYLALTIEKIMTIEFLMNYDWKEMERLKDWSFGWNNIPDMASKVYIRRRSVEEVEELWNLD